MFEFQVILPFALKLWIVLLRKEIMAEVRCSVNWLYVVDTVSAIISHMHIRTELMTLKSQTVRKMFNMVSKKSDFWI